jgi:hypothetical protein
VADETRNAPTWVTWLLVVVGVLLVVAGIVYLTRPAAQLPTWFPGHDAAMKNHKHVKHAVAVFGLALLCGIGVWFSLGRRSVSAR